MATNFCYSCGLLSHGIKECPGSSANALQNNGELQYGAWLRGEPMRRGVKEVHSSGIGGGLEGGVVTRTRPKVEKSLHTEPREASVVGSFHAPRLADKGDNSPT